jgi:hypothetical protein
LEPDCVLLDSSASDDYGDSWELASALHRRGRPIPVIMFSGHVLPVEKRGKAKRSERRMRPSQPSLRSLSTSMSYSRQLRLRPDSLCASTAPVRSRIAARENWSGLWKHTGPVTCGPRNSANGLCFGIGVGICARCTGGSCAGYTRSADSTMRVSWSCSANSSVATPRSRSRWPPSASPMVSDPGASRTVRG